MRFRGMRAGQPALRTIRSGRTTTARARPWCSHRSRTPSRSSTVTSLPSARRTRSRAPCPSYLRLAGAQDVVQPARPAVEQHLGLRQELSGQAAPRPPAALDEGSGAQGGGPAVGRQPLDRRNAPDGPEHALPQDRARPAAPGHEPTEQAGHADQRPGVRLALGLVGVEELLRRRPGEDVGELPGQLVDVAEPQDRGPAPRTAGSGGPRPPASRIRPARQRSATCARNVYSTARTNSTAPESTGASRSPRNAGVVRSATAPPAPSGTPTGTGPR
jgi:hypothetical protein